MSKMFIILIFTLIASTSIMDAQTEENIFPDCGPNGIWKNCGSFCPRTCQRPIGRMLFRCPTVCRKGCVCNTGYILVSRTNSTCIPNHECPRLKKNE
ncbi:chymotrypsin-elastase inhibitor ixodidin-like [Leptopilina heterotoma]|uniref:chymotrypsin-elastase inhibitor ixodidin-like n=1 Tax=Leptopilina heterotoma TaxID=63436 RepID=UPI001CA94ED9|nr:chymotrypsin-elastase inhibitor ixodidin-like [Leptopilina heterotoma]